MPKCEIKSADLMIEARFAEPAFGLRQEQTATIHREVFSALRRVLPVTANDVTIDLSPNLGQQGVTYNLPSIGALVKLQVARVEFIVSDTRRLSFADGQAMFSGVMAALYQMLPGFAIELYSAVVSMHVSIEGQTGRQLVDPHVAKELEGLGPSTGHAVAYYFGEQGARRMHAIILDGSVLVKDGLYIRQNIEFNGKDIDFASFPQILNDAVMNTLKALDLERVN